MVFCLSRKCCDGAHTARFSHRNMLCANIHNMHIDQRMRQYLQILHKHLCPTLHFITAPIWRTKAVPHGLQHDARDKAAGGVVVRNTQRATRRYGWQRPGEVVQLHLSHQ